MAGNPYEKRALLNQYLHFHYAKPEEFLPYPFGPTDALDYAVRLVTDCMDVSRLSVRSRGLDLGCAVGRSSFELARHCGEVLGVDLSRTFIKAAKLLQSGNPVAYETPDEGTLTTPRVARAPEGVDASRVSFEVGDALKLREDIGTFDVLLMANLLDRLPDPRRLLARLPSLVKARGQLVITSPFTWLPEYTPRAKWLGGMKRGGRALHTFDTLQGSLSKDFTLARRLDVPLLIRDHVRKYQWSVADATVWERKS